MGSRYTWIKPFHIGYKRPLTRLSPLVKSGTMVSWLSYQVLDAPARIGLITHFGQETG